MSNARILFEGATFTVSVGNIEPAVRLRPEEKNALGQRISLEWGTKAFLAAINAGTIKFLSP